MTTISFVIPTFNFAAFLPETLDSIVDEGHAPIEIIVFDGGSSDNTLEVLEAYRAKFPALRVLVATERGNIDTDLNQAVAAATGDYIWTMSADDVLMPGWSREIVPRLKRITPDLLLVPAVHCDITMRPRRNYPILRNPAQGELVTAIANDEDMLAYLDRVRTSEGMFSFCSACLVRRERLFAAPTLETANGTCWRYAGRLLAVLAAYPTTIAVLAKPLIAKRGDNDSFSEAGVIRRLKIATINWDEVIEGMGLNLRVSRAMARLAKSDIRPTTILCFSQFVRDREEKVIYDQCVRARLNNSRNERALAWVLERLPSISALRMSISVAKRFVRVIQQRLWHAEMQAAMRPAAEKQR